MYGFAPDLEIEGLISSELEQICIGKFDVQFHFGSGTFIAVQGRVKILNNGDQIARWTEEQSWDTPAFHELLNQAVKGYSVASRDVLRIDFDNGLTLELIDSSDQYESVQIYPNGKSGPIIVV